MLSICISYSVPVALWLIFKKKTNARVFPLLTGIFSYMVLISFTRGIARSLILSDELKKNLLLYFFISSLISGLSEEVGKYLVLSRLIPKYDSITDYISYGIGHETAEILLTHSVLENTLDESIFECYEYTSGILFSVSMTVLIFVAVNSNKKMLWVATALHTAIDYIKYFYLMGFLTFIEIMLIDILATFSVCYFAFIVYKNDSERL